MEHRNNSTLYGQGGGRPASPAMQPAPPGRIAPNGFHPPPFNGGAHNTGCVEEGDHDMAIGIEEAAGTKGRVHFPSRLYMMINDISLQSAIHWTHDGSGVVFANTQEFTMALSRYFNTNKVQSFIKQLKNYGFDKVENTQGMPSHWHHYAHSNFHRDQPHMLKAVKRNDPGFRTYPLHIDASSPSRDFKRVFQSHPQGCQPDWSPAFSLMVQKLDRCNETIERLSNEVKQLLGVVSFLLDPSREQCHHPVNHAAAPSTGINGYSNTTTPVEHPYPSQQQPQQADIQMLNQNTYRNTGSWTSGPFFLPGQFDNTFANPNHHTSQPTVDMSTWSAPSDNLSYSPPMANPGQTISQPIHTTLPAPSYTDQSPAYQHNAPATALEPDVNQISHAHSATTDNGQTSQQAGPQQSAVAYSSNPGRLAKPAQGLRQPTVPQLGCPGARNLPVAYIPAPPPSLSQGSGDSTGGANSNVNGQSSSYTSWPWRFSTSEPSTNHSQG